MAQGLEHQEFCVQNKQRLSFTPCMEKVGEGESTQEFYRLQCKSIRIFLGDTLEDVD